MLFKFTAVTAIKGLNVPMNQLLNILISHQHYFTNTPAVAERSNTGFSGKAGQRSLLPRPIPTYLPAVRHPSAMLIQGFIINSYFQAVHFRKPGYGSAPRAILMAQVRHIRHRGQEGTCRMSSWGAGTSEAGFAVEPGCSAPTQVPLRAA